MSFVSHLWQWRWFSFLTAGVLLLWRVAVSQYVSALATSPSPPIPLGRVAGVFTKPGYVLNSLMLRMDHSLVGPLGVGKQWLCCP